MINDEFHSTQLSTLKNQLFMILLKKIIFKNPLYTEGVLLNYEC